MYIESIHGDYMTLAQTTNSYNAKPNPKPNPKPDNNTKPYPAP